MKLKNLFELVGTKIITKQTSIDPNTGKISWDVEYEPDFTDVLNSFNTLIEDLDNTIKKHGIRDASIITSLKALRATKSALLKTLQSKYPEYIKDYKN